MKSRLYSLFHKVGKRHIRQTGLAYGKSAAVRIFQSALLDGFFAGKGASLRVVKASYSATELESVAAGSNLTIHECCKILDSRTTGESLQ